MSESNVLVITAVSFLISYYTCSLIIYTAGSDEDFSDTLYKHFGKPGWYIGLIAPIILIFGAVTVYFIIQSQMMYPIIMALVSWIAGSE